MENKQNPYVKSIVSGVAVVGEMTLGGLFLENLKMEKQRTSKPYPFLARQMLSQGIKGFEAGLVPWGIIIGLGKGTSLGLAHSTIKNKCAQHDISPSTTTYLAGFGAGGFQGACISPLMLARTRVNEVIATRPKAGTWGEEIKMSTSVLNTVIKKEGLYSLFNGMGATVMKRSFDWGLRFGIKSHIETYIHKYDYNMSPTTVSLGSAFTSGALSALITTPVDRVIPLLQSSNGTGVGTLLKEKISTEGYSTLFRGYGIRAIHTGWHTTFAIFVADALYKKVYNVTNSSK